jgi:hypothetical protein
MRTKKSTTPSDMDEFDDLSKIATPHIPVEAPEDIFNNLDDIKVSQDYVSQVQVEKLLTKIPVKRPEFPKFVRVNPDPAYRLDTVLVEVKYAREAWFFPTPHMRARMSDHIKAVRLFTAITRQGTLYLWPAKLPDPNNPMTVPWAESGLDAAEMCMTRWYQIKGNTEISGFELTPGSELLPEPVWPTRTFNELMKIAFRELMIRDENHPIYRELNGLP